MARKAKQAKQSVKIDKTSQKAFKITSNVTTSVLQTLREMRAGLHVKLP